MEKPETIAEPPKSKVELELLKLEEQKNRLLDGLKTELAKTLSSACEKHKLLKKLGCLNVLYEPQFAEFVQVLGISPILTKAPPSTSTKSGSVKGTVAQVLSDGKEYNIAALTTAVESIYGKASKAAINNALMLLKKEKSIKRTGRGLYQLS